MRIISGSAAGRALKAPKGFAVRPTPDLVKQAVFNSLGPSVDGARVLELFAGTGSLSLECLSRGAASIVCVEISSRNAEFIRANLLACGLEPHQMEIRIQDVSVAINQLAQLNRQFDLIIADPPYGQKNVGHRSQSMAQQLLDNAVLPRLVASGGRLVLGHTKRDALDVPSPWTELKKLHHGDSVMRFFEPEFVPPPANLNS
jgi:16S rRNA (guanine966-N2)-methyltransferase